MLTHAEVVSRLKAAIERAEKLIPPKTGVYAPFREVRTEHPAAMKALLEIAERHKPSRLVDGPEFCRRCIQIGERLDLAAWPCCDFLAIAEAVRGMEA